MAIREKINRAVKCTAKNCEPFTHLEDQMVNNSLLQMSRKLKSHQQLK